MLLRWLTNWKRRTLRAQPFPAAWLEILSQNVRDYAVLSAEEQARVRAYIQIFVAEKNWEGCGGQKMTPEVQVTIAGQVGLMTLGLEEQYFERVLSILVYPTVYRAPHQTVVAGGLVLEGGDSFRSGEAWPRGPVIFSWADVLAAGQRETAGNVVYHEFAHQLDMLNGASADGNPPLESDELARRWPGVMKEHYDELVHDCREGEGTLLDCYGATNRAEFFAVATETFFTRGRTMAVVHPPLYEMLREFYRQNPASRS